jgi:hypothetical protein
VTQSLTHKPSIIKSIEQKKIKEFTPNEKEAANSELISWALSLLGISESGQNERILHYMAVDQYISDELGRYSYQEVKEAFKMYVRGDFSHAFDKVIYKLDCVILAKIIKCYQIEKIRLTANYDNQVKRGILELQAKENEPTEEEKRNIVLGGLREAYSDFKNKMVYNDLGRLYLYEVLYEAEMLPTDKATKTAVLKVAEINLKKKRSQAISKEEKAKLNILNANGKTSNVLINECKRISIQRCFSSFTTWDQFENKFNLKTAIWKE